MLARVVLEDSKSVPIGKDSICTHVPAAFLLDAQEERLGKTKPLTSPQYCVVCIFGLRHQIPVRFPRALPQPPDKGGRS